MRFSLEPLNAFSWFFTLRHIMINIKNWQSQILENFISQGLFLTFVGCNYRTQSSALSFSKNIFIRNGKNGICLVGASKENILFFRKCALKNAPMAPMSRIDPVSCLSVIQVKVESATDFRIYKFRGSGIWLVLFF